MIDKLFEKLFGAGAGVPEQTGPVEFIVAGLGNPGEKYQHTRHNAGWLALDYIASQKKATLSRIRFKSLCGECELGGRRVLLLKPTTYMNLSGQAVREAMDFYKLEPEQVLVLFDDVSLDPGALRIRRKGSDGGHNGMKNIIYLTGRDDFPRIKIGIGKKPHPEMDMANYVTGKFTDAERKALEPVWDRIYQAAALIAAGDITEAMNRYNTKPSKEKPKPEATDS